MTDCPHDDRPDLCPMCEIDRLLALKEAADRLAKALDLFIADNGHLADGEDCTLAPLIKALAKYREKR